MKSLIKTIPHSLKYYLPPGVVAFGPVIFFNLYYQALNISGHLPITNQEKYDTLIDE